MRERRDRNKNQAKSVANVRAACMFKPVCKLTVFHLASSSTKLASIASYEVANGPTIAYAHHLHVDLC